MFFRAFLSGKQGPPASIFRGSCASPLVFGTLFGRSVGNSLPLSFPRARRANAEPFYLDTLPQGQVGGIGVVVSPRTLTQYLAGRGGEILVGDRPVGREPFSNLVGEFLRDGLVGTVESRRY